MLILTFCSPNYQQLCPQVCSIKGIDCETQSLNYSFFNLTLLPFGPVIFFFHDLKNLATFPLM